MPEQETAPNSAAANDSYRNAISTVDRQGRRVWIYPRRVAGKFYRARTYLSYLLLFLFFAGPFLKVDGQPLLLLNVLQRRFVILGKTFFPQDFFIFALAFLAIAVSIILFTVVYGRIFCGWLCPQTVFLEMVFRKIEFLIDGDGPAQRKLNAQPWTISKIFRRGIKLAVFYGIAFMVGNTLLAYIIGIEELIRIVTDSPFNHLFGLFAMVIFSSGFFFVYAYFREQVCTLVCPYGRLQSVLLDRDSIVVAYDFKRGEPRRHLNKKEAARQAGDCIDCSLCVQVCPTGIDIRNGTQLECVNCANCIDACNLIMGKAGFPPGLIRYDSYHRIATGNKKKISLRAFAYTVVLTLLATFVIFLLVTRRPIETTILRTPGVMYQETADQHISNLYNYRFVNKTNLPIPLELKLLSPEGQIRLVGADILVAQSDLAEGAFFVDVPRSKIFSTNLMIQIGLYQQGQLIDTITTSFTAPRP